jgi:hypothetical protein
MAEWSIHTHQQEEGAVLHPMDRFLVKHGLLSGEPTLKMPDSGVHFVPAP